ncbi:MAG: DciA family protein [Acidobacteriota bacterium]
MRSISKILSEIVQIQAADDDFCLAVLQSLWPHLAGVGVAEHSAPVGLKGHALVVATSNPIWQKELESLSGLLLGAIGGWVGGGRIRFLSFSVQALPEKRLAARTPARETTSTLTEAEISQWVAAIPEGKLQDALLSLFRAFPYEGLRAKD